MPAFELIASRRAGSAIVEMAFALAGLPLAVTRLPYLEPGPGRDRLLALNPLGQVPTLVLPDGGVMTESAAILLHLDDLAPEAGLFPRAGDPARAGALNRLMIFAGALYPTFTFGDTPEQWAGPGDAAATLLRAIDDRRAGIWRRLEQSARPAPFLDGPAPGALDLYVAVMTQWQPRFPWFERHAPRLAGVARAVAAHPTLAPVMARNFDALP